MASIRAPLRALGETLGPVLWIGWRRRHDVAPLLEGAILLARGVPNVGFSDVLMFGRFGLPLYLGLAWWFSCGLFFCSG